METIHISIEEFNKMKKIKPDVVHLHRGQIYKRSPQSFDIIKAVDELRNEKPFRHIAVPSAYLYDKKRYFGYAMKYYKKLRQVEEAIAKGIIKDIEKYALELLGIIDELNKLKMCYWDLHFENILSDQKGHPFILDLDDIELLPSKEDLHNQREYLTEFLLILYLGKRKSVYSYARDLTIQKYFSEKTLMYLDTLGNLTEPVPDLPFCIIEELQDREKRDMIKSKLNN